jgi:hypothetical protein
VCTIVNNLFSGAMFDVSSMIFSYECSAILAHGDLGSTVCDIYHRRRFKNLPYLHYKNFVDLWPSNLVTKSSQ